jgi:hypothetical protein
MKKALSIIFCTKSLTLVSNTPIVNISGILDHERLMNNSSKVLNDHTDPENVRQIKLNITDANGYYFEKEE